MDFVDVILQKEEYPNGFLLVFVVHYSDTSCTENNPPSIEDPDINEVESYRRKEAVQLVIIEQDNFNVRLMSWITLTICFVWLFIFIIFFYHEKG